MIRTATSESPAGEISPAKNPTPQRPIIPRAAWLFLGKLPGWYLALMLLWLPLGPLYRSGLIAAGNAAFSIFGADQETLFLHHADWRKAGITDRADLAILIRRSTWTDQEGRKQHVLAKAVSTFYQPFTALVFLLALFLATPLPWKKRALKTASATLGLHLCMFACVAIDVAHAFDAYGDRPHDALGWGNVAINVLHATVTDWPVGVFIVPLLLWLAHCRGVLSPDFFRGDART